MRNLYRAIALLGIIVLIGTFSTVLVTAQTSEAQSLPWIGVFYSSTIPGQGNSATASFTGLSQNWAGAPTGPGGSALPGIPADAWSARFSTTATFTEGLWAFTAVADDGVRVLVNGNPVIDALASTGATTQTGTTNLSSGTYNIVVELVDVSGAATIQVSWAPSTGEGAGAVASANLGAVAGVRGLAVRTGPFLGASMVAIARPGKDYPVLAKNTQEGLYTWYYIQYDEDTQGWVSGRYFGFTAGHPDNVELQETTIFDEVGDPRGQVFGETRSVMNFRTYPSQRTVRVNGVPQIYWGARVRILTRTVQGGKNFWYQVAYTPPNTSTTYVGWIYAPYVQLAAGSDPIDVVPVR